MRTLIADSRSELIPLTRGKPDLRGDRIESSRLIPTHAGKTKREERGPLRPDGLIPAHAGKTRRSAR